MPNIEITSNQDFNTQNLATSNDARNTINKAGEALKILNTHTNNKKTNHEKNIREGIDK